MVYFDFDGTLADVWLRFYRIFTDASGIDGIAFEDYVRTKKQHPRDGDVAACFGAALPEDYWSKKRSMLEDPAYLALTGCWCRRKSSVISSGNLTAGS